ncbi:MAG: glutathione peroxidase [Minwuia sp.]|nr:glutathione peroxidase [Minwuia sp.]
MVNDSLPTGAVDRRHVLGLGLLMLAGAASLTAAPARADTTSAHDFAFTSIDGDPLPMSRFRGKAVLLVNTASHCGFTHQYDGLQTLWETYRDRGLVVLGVPSDDFNQELGSEAAIKRFCEVNFAIDFPMTALQSVKGRGAHPLYRWIADSQGRSAAPRWNFYKYLIAPDGQLVGNWPSNVGPKSRELRAAIEATLPPA